MKKYEPSVTHFTTSNKRELIKISNIHLFINITTTTILRFPLLQHNFP